MNDQEPVAQITGTVDGIGWATARLFSASGYRVVRVDIDKDSVKPRAQELRGKAIRLG
jgi:NAD(P)-dependent dehydrogenase (short-subunit alcohol dehydrogenase family)